MKIKKRADDYNYQTRALEFRVGETVALILGSGNDVGRVIEVFPAIGMVQIQWPNTTSRHPVEDLQIINPGTSPFLAPRYQTVPGGQGVAPVSWGPPVDDIPVNSVQPLTQNVRRIDEPTLNDKKKKKLAARISQAFVKKSLYWHGVGRQYRCNKSEVDEGKFLCPKCKEIILRNAVYKREDGISVKLLACPQCLFLIRRNDVFDPSIVNECEGENL